MRKNGRLRRRDIRFLEKCAAQDLEEKKKQRHSVLPMMMSTRDTQNVLSSLKKHAKKNKKKSLLKEIDKRTVLLHALNSCLLGSFFCFYPRKDQSAHSQKKVPHKRNTK